MGVPRNYKSLVQKHGVAAGASWNLWWALILFVLDEPLTRPERELVMRAIGRDLPKAKALRLIAIFVGRRGGKDSSAAILIVYLAVLGKWKLSRGEVAVVLLLAVDREQAKVAFKYIRGLLEAIPELAREVETVTNDRILLRSGLEVQVGTSDYKSVRGRTVVAAVLDEFAFWMDDDAVEVLRALRPAMITQADAKLFVITSIYGRQGKAFELFSQWGEDSPSQLIVRGTTREFNPTVPQAEIEAELKADPHGAGAEYMTIPRSDVARFIDAELLDSITRGSPRDLPYQSTTQHGGSYSYFAALDVSGGRGDATAAAVARIDREKVVLCAARYWIAPHDPLVVAKQVAEFFKSFHLAHAVADQYGAEVVRSVYREAGVELMASEQSKSDTFIAMLPLLTTGRAELSDEPKLRAELIALERRTTRNAREIVDHPPHGHDDVANAAALALVRASRNIDTGDFQAELIRSAIFDDYIDPNGGSRGPLNF